MRIAYALLACLAVACTLPSPSPSIPIDVGVEDDLTLLAEAQEAGEAWNVACQRDLVHVHAAPGEIRLHGQSGRIAHNVVGRTYLRVRVAFEIAVQTDDPDVPVMPTIAHEMGHALGLDHMPERLMRKSLPSGVLDPDGHLAQGMITQEECEAIQR